MELEQHIQRGRAHRELGALLLLVRHVPASATITVAKSDVRMRPQCANAGMLGSGGWLASAGTYVPGSSCQSSHCWSVICK
jgi:hypothetical protein